jgi:hypothetical protein
LSLRPLHRVFRASLSKSFWRKSRGRALSAKGTVTVLTRSGSRETRWQIL